MNLLQRMENECDCIEVIFQDYIQSRNLYNIFVFFEGKDDFKYYCARLSLITGERVYKHYICQNKRNVIEIYRMINAKASKKNNEKLLYFIDRDFDKSNDLPHDIYVTPVYSIENFYVTDNAFKRIIKGELGFSDEMNEEDKRDFEAGVSYLIEKRDEVINSMIYANAWYSLQCNVKNVGKQNPKLSAIKDFDIIKDVTNKDRLEEMVPFSVALSETDIENEMQYLREDPVGRLRGKYFEQTIPFYINKLFEDSNKKKNRVIFSKRRKVNIVIGKDNMISILSNYADVPEGLYQYILNKFESVNKRSC